MSDIPDSVEGQVVVTNGRLVVQQDLGSKLDSIIGGLAGIRQALNSKADKSDIAAVRASLEAQGKDINDLKEWRHDQELLAKAKADQKREEKALWGRKWSIREKILMLTASSASAAATFFAVFHPH